MKGIISINSGDIEQSIALLNDSVGSVENDTYNYVDSYSTLEELGLVDNSVQLVKKQINDIVKSQKDVIKDLNEHLETYVQAENEIIDLINSYDYSKDDVSRVTVESEYEESSLFEDDERNVTKGSLVKFVKEIDYEVEEILLKNLSKNAKALDTDLDNLVMNKKKSGLLVELLKKLVGDTNTDIDTTNTNRTLKVQNALFNKIADTAGDIKGDSLNETLLSSTSYLKDVAEENSMRLTDLLNNDDNKEKLLNGLKDLYLGKKTNTYEPRSNEINSFRNYINKIAENNNMTPESLLSSVENLKLIKKGA